MALEIIIFVAAILFSVIIFTINSQNKKQQEWEKKESCIKENDKYIDNVISELLASKADALIRKKQRLESMSHSLWIDELGYLTESAIRPRLLLKIPHSNYFNDTEEQYLAIARKINSRILQIELDKDEDWN
jgi:hypothetical protein